MKNQLNAVAANGLVVNGFGLDADRSFCFGPTSGHTKGDGQVVKAEEQRQRKVDKDSGRQPRPTWTSWSRSSFAVDANI